MDPLYKEIRITKITQETADTKSFAFVPVGDTEFAYESGQFMTLVFNNGEQESRRSYSFSSSPLLDEDMQITVKRIPNGEFSRHLFDHVREGDILLTTGSSGFFQLPSSPMEVSSYCFLAAGSGITPVFSLLKTIMHTTSAAVILIYSNRNESSTIFYEQLINLQEKFGARLKIEFLFSHLAHVKRRWLSKWVLIGLLEKYSLDLANTLFYLCGPLDYMLVAGITLITAGVPTHHIKKEIFNTRKHVVVPVPPDTDEHLVEVMLNGRIELFPVKHPETILSAAKKRNIPLPYSCEVGNCGSCAATCISGKVWMAYNEVLMDDEIASGKILTCQGYPVNGDIILQF